MYDATGIVPLEGRGDLPFALLHREPLFLHGVRTLLAMERLGGGVVVTVDRHQLVRATQALAHHRLPVAVHEGVAWWERRSRQASSRSVVLLDPLCPLVPASFVDRLSRSAAAGVAVAAYRPVTDTIKTVVDHQIVDTIDRDQYAIITSPVVLPGACLRQGTPPVRDFAQLVAWLRLGGDVELVKGPSMGRRVDDDSAVSLLECVDEIARTVQER